MMNGVLYMNNECQHVFNIQISSSNYFKQFGKTYSCGLCGLSKLYYDWANSKHGIRIIQRIKTHGYI